MSPEQPAVVAEPPIRRRIVSAPQRTALPVALIVRDRGSLPSLEAMLQDARPVVVFPSLSHFCTESHRSERWGGIIVARACAWDARLDDYVLHRECMALYGEAEGYGWPDSIPRLGDEGVPGWLGQLDVPRVRLPPPKPRKVRPAGEPAARKRSRKVFSLWAPTSGAVSTTPAPAPVAAQASQVTVASAAGAASGRTDKRREARSAQQTLPFVDTARAEKKRVEKKQPARAALPEPRTSEAERRALAHAVGKRMVQPISARQEERLARMGIEIGLNRAYALLEQLRARAQRLASERGKARR
jgi:hypothetical protein